MDLRKQAPETFYNFFFFLLVEHICNLPLFIIIDKTVQAFCFLKSWMSYVMSKMHQWQVKLGCRTCGDTTVLNLMTCLFNHWDKRSDLVHWEDLEGLGGEGGGRGDRDGEHM